MFKDLRSRALFAGGATLLFAGLAGCPSYTFLEILPERVTENQIIIEPGKPIPADILFVVDNSCSMEDEQDLLAQNFADFIETLTRARADYRIGVVTTSLQGSGTVPNGEAAGITQSDFESMFPFKYSGVKPGSTCAPTGIPHGCFRGPDADARIISSDMPAPSQIAAFRDNVRVGSCGSGTEEGLSAMLAAVRLMSGGGCNEGFLREEANLVVVIVSDEEDQSRDRNLDTILEQLAQLKPISRVRFAAIVGAEQTSSGAQAARCRIGLGNQCGGLCEELPQQGSLQSCGESRRCTDGSEICNLAGECVERVFQFYPECHWCSYYNAPDCCSALRGERYVSFGKRIEAAVASQSARISATGCKLQNPDGVQVACLIDSICQESFSDTLRRIATDLVIINEVHLSPPASYPAGVVVRVNGEEWVNGVDYEVTAEGDLLLYKARSPGEGDVVEVFYTLPN